MKPKMIQYPPQMGLRPRPADDYDLLCLRFYYASSACNVARASAAARDLIERVWKPARERPGTPHCRSTCSPATPPTTRRRP